MFYFIWTIITQPLPSSPVETLPIFQASLILYVFHFVLDLCISYLVWVLIALFFPTLEHLVSP